MKKVLALGAAALLVAAAVFAQPPAPDAPAAPAAPACPQAPGMGMGMGQGMGPMHGHGMQCGHGMQGKAGMRGGRQGMRGMGRQGNMAGLMIMRHAKEIGLSDQQIEQFKTMQEAHRLDMIDARANLEKAQVRVKSLMGDKNAGDQEVLRAIDQVSQARAEIAKKRYLNRQECRSLLTEDQQAKLKELREDRQGNRREMRMERQDQRRNFRDRRFDSQG
jgi:hypothetical protein